MAVPDTGSENVTVILSVPLDSASSIAGAMPSETEADWLCMGLSRAVGYVRACARPPRSLYSPKNLATCVNKDALSRMSPPPEPASAPTSIPDVS